MRVLFRIRGLWRRRSIQHAFDTIHLILRRIAQQLRQLLHIHAPRTRSTLQRNTQHLNLTRMLMVMRMLLLRFHNPHHPRIHAKHNLFTHPSLRTLRPRNLWLDIHFQNHILDILDPALTHQLPLIQHHQIRIPRLDLRSITRILVPFPVLHINHTQHAVQTVFPRLAAQPVDLHSQSRGERGARGLDDDAVGLDVACEGREGVGELADEVAAYAAIEQFLDAGDGGGRGERGIDGDVAVFVFEEGEFVGGGELGDEVEDEGCVVLGMKRMGR
jgi:hypothetical protein